jgi:hypothetical protein
MPERRRISDSSLFAAIEQLTSVSSPSVSFFF